MTVVYAGAVLTGKERSARSHVMEYLLRRFGRQGMPTLFYICEICHRTPVEQSSFRRRDEPRSRSMRWARVDKGCRLRTLCSHEPAAAAHE